MSSPLVPPGQPLPMQPGEFKGAAVPNLVTFRYKDVDPPSPLYIQRDDVMIFTALASSGPSTVKLFARLWLADKGVIVPIEKDLAVGANHAAASVAVNLAEGYLLSVVVVGVATAMQGGVYATVVIARSGVTIPPPSPAASLIAGYCTFNVPQCWPGGQRYLPGEGTGYLLSQPVANPGAGNDWNTIANSNAAWELMYFAATLTTSGVAGNRSVQLILDDGANNLYVGPPSATIPASTTATVSGAQLNTTSTVVATDISVGIPPRNIITGGFRIRTLTAGLLAGDVWSAINLGVREWLLQ